jgi:hypothetical protein
VARPWPFSRLAICDEIFRDATHRGVEHLYCSVRVCHDAIAKQARPLEHAAGEYVLLKRGEAAKQDPTRKRRGVTAGGSRAQCPRMIGDVLADEAGNKVVAVIETGMDTQRQWVPDRVTCVLEELRPELPVKKFVRSSLFN